MWFKKDTSNKPVKKEANGIDYLEIAGDPGAPTIVLFHGFGADYNDLVSLYKTYSGAQRATWIFPNGPVKVSLGFGFSGRSWFEIDLDLLQAAFRAEDYESVEDAFPEEIAEIRKQIDGFLAKLNISPHQLILGGFSQGAVLATEVALNSSKKFAGLAIFSGTLVHQKQWAKLATQKKSMPFFQTHGKNDPILPFVLAQNLEALLLEAKFDGQLHPFEGGHELNHALLPAFDQFLHSIWNPSKKT